MRVYLNYYAYARTRQFLIGKRYSLFCVILFVSCLFEFQSAAGNST